MRTLDVGVAAGYAILCISLISLLSPYSAEGTGEAALSSARASSAIAAYVEQVGLPFLATASTSSFCSSLSAASNASIIYGGSIGGSACGAAPVRFVGSSDLRFVVSGTRVEIEAWVEGQ